MNATTVMNLNCKNIVYFRDSKNKRYLLIAECSMKDVLAFLPISQRTGECAEIFLNELWRSEWFIDFPIPGNMRKFTSNYTSFGYLILFNCFYWKPSITLTYDFCLCSWTWTWTRGKTGPSEKLLHIFTCSCFMLVLYLPHIRIK